MENNIEKHINRRALLHRMGAFTEATAVHSTLMGASQSINPNKQLKDESYTNKKESSLTIPSWYYQQFDADYALDVPE